jgi:hypothetical protein
MPFIVSQHIYAEALRSLERLDQVVLFATKGVTYPAISMHPDIFFCQVDDLLLASEAVPEHILRKITDAGVTLEVVPHKPGMKHPHSAIFNAVVTPKHLIHRTDITHISIKNRCAQKKPIHVNQAYTRCNLVTAGEDLWITSDRGIERALKTHGKSPLFIDPCQVILEGFPHGFFGGCCGIWESTLLVNGSLKHLREEKLLRKAAEMADLSILELANTPPTDIGGIFTLGQGYALTQHNPLII